MAFAGKRRTRHGGHLRAGLALSRPLRILHCPEDVGGQPSSLALAERRLGLDSISVSFVPTPFGYDTDEVLRRPGDSRLLFERRRLATFLRAARWFDIVHFNFGRSLAPARPFRLLDVPVLRRLGVGVVVTFQGDDVRRGDVPKNVDRARRRTARVFEASAHHMFFLNPDLAPYLPSRAEFLPYGSVDIGAWAPPHGLSDSAVPLVVHAPSDRGVKGTEHVLEAVARLRAEGLEFEFELVEGLTRPEARRVYERADIFVDQLLLGWYGGAAVEAMALGKPVVCHISETDLHVIPREMQDDLPIVRAGPAMLADVLRILIAAPAERRRELGRASRSFVERWHDPATVASRARDVYESIGPRRGPSRLWP